MSGRSTSEEKNPRIEGLEAEVRDLKKVENYIIEQRDLALSLGASRSLHEGLEICFDSALRVSEMDCGGIYLVDKSSGDLNMICQKGLLPDFIESTSHFKAGSANTRLIMNGKPLYTQHCQLDVELSPAEKAVALRAVAIIPILDENKVIGCFNIASHVFDDVPALSRIVLESISAQIGGAIARLEATDALAAVHSGLEKEVAHRTAELLKTNSRLEKEVRDHEETTEALRENEEMFSKAFHSNAALMAISTMDNGRYVQVNQQFLAVLGYERGEIVGSTSRKLDIFADYEQRETIKRIVQKEGSARNVEVAIRTKSGSVRYGLFSIDIIQLQNRPCFLTVMNDITDRKLAEASLAERESQYRKLFEQSNDAIIVHTLDGRILDVNTRTCEMLGYSYNRLRSLRIKTLFPAQAEAKRKEAFQTLREQGSIFFESFFQKADGTVLNVEITSRISEPEKGLALGIVRDVTERKRAQELMIQTEKMMSVGGLAAGMAHEINNPLGGIFQSIQNTERRLSPDFEKNLPVAEECGIDLHSLQMYLEKREIVGFLADIKEAAGRAAKIIRNMLRFSRKSESKFVPADLAKLLDQIVELAGNDYDLKKSYDFRNVEISREYEPGMKAVPCTKTEIGQVVLNLLRNSAQAAMEAKLPQRMRITLRTKTDGDMVRIEVADNGPGMEEAVRKRIFEPFFTTKPIGEGTGLGLSVSYMIITANHQGSIEVESELGKGTCFIIRLPLERKPS
ncbi:MAG: PAS domain S-box protein [Proteobacteria bacterium]|nr:PAS domain S-box protein [Pseudomonadota bacterium]